MIFICDDIPSRLLTKHAFLDDIEGLFIKLNFSYFLEHVTRHLKETQIISTI